MTESACPFCGRNALEQRRGEYRFDPPPNVPGGTMVVPDAEWFECTACGEHILSPDLEEALNGLRYARSGLLTPAEIRAVRSRTGLTAVDMAALMGVGEKTYTRWESGKSLHNKSNDNLIRLVDLNAGIFQGLEAERQPDRDNAVLSYVSSLETLKGQSPCAMAAHGTDLSAHDVGALRDRLRQLRNSKEASA